MEEGRNEDGRNEGGESRTGRRRRKGGQGKGGGGRRDAVGGATTHSWCAEKEKKGERGKNPKSEVKVGDITTNHQKYKRTVEQSMKL